MASFDRELLNGVNVIDAEVTAEKSGEWKGELYRPIRRAKEKSVRVRFIPYFAWGNRGESEMSVWLSRK